jgi:hypothetical protein
VICLTYLTTRTAQPRFSGSLLSFCRSSSRSWYDKVFESAPAIPSQHTPRLSKQHRRTVESHSLQRLFHIGDGAECDPVHKRSECWSSPGFVDPERVRAVCGWDRGQIRVRLRERHSLGRHRGWDIPRLCRGVDVHPIVRRVLRAWAFVAGAGDHCASDELLLDRRRVHRRPRKVLRAGVVHVLPSTST